MTENSILVEISRGNYGKKTQGAFHYAKDSGNFGWDSNGKVRFGFFWPEYSGSPLEVVHIFRSEYSEQNSPFHFWQTGSLPLLGNSEKEFKLTTAISIGWPDLIGKCRSIFLGYYHWSLTGQFGITESTPNFLRFEGLGCYGNEVLIEKAYHWLPKMHLAFKCRKALLLYFP